MCEISMLHWVSKRRSKRNEKPQMLATPNECWTCDSYSPDGRQCCWREGLDTIRQKGGKQEDLLGKHVDDASSQSLVTNTTDPFFRDGDVACPGPAPPNAFTEDELGLSLHVAGLAQVCHDAGLVEDGIGCAHPAFEVELQFLHGQRRRNQGQGCVCR